MRRLKERTIEQERKLGSSRKVSVSHGVARLGRGRVMKSWKRGERGQSESGAGGHRAYGPPAVQFSPLSRGRKGSAGAEAGRATGEGFKGGRGKEGCLRVKTAGSWCGSVPSRPGGGRRTGFAALCAGARGSEVGSAGPDPRATVQF